MNLHVRDCLVEGYEDLIPGIRLPDPQDRHVLAAAVRAHAEIILTYNLSDFPPEDLAKFGVQALHPDEFLGILFAREPDLFLRVVEETRKSLRNPPKSVEEYLLILEKQSLCNTVSTLEAEYSGVLALI